MKTKLRQSTKKKIRQIVPLSNSLNEKLNVRHQSLSSVPCVKLVYKSRTCCRCPSPYLFCLPVICILLGGVIAAICLTLFKTSAITTSTTTTTTTTATTTTSTTSTTSTTTSTTTTSTTSTTTSTSTTSTTTTSTTSTTSTTTTTTTTSTATTRTTSTTTSTTSKTTTSITTINCVSPYVRTPSQTCVNIMIDFYNCGAVGYVCASTYTSCSAGVCSTAPAIQLANPNTIWSSPTDGSVDDDMLGVSLPFSITLYGTTRNYVTVTTNGVKNIQ
ncbi:unnamed protein product [Rotaria sp. Silwood1]|nr:unnamed protein product [Rotaria sp. Silwood1]